MCDIYDELKEAHDRGELERGKLEGTIESYSDTVNKAITILLVLRNVTPEAITNTAHAYSILEELQKPEYYFKPKDKDELIEIAKALTRLGYLREKDYRPAR
jgi:hypothetical protein